MAAGTLKNAQRLYYFKRPSRWSNGIGTELPEAYKKFWREWKIQQPAAVHYIEKKGMFERDEETGVVVPIQNVPLPLKFPKEINDGIWGGETVVQGFHKKARYGRRVPHFWVPKLWRTIVHSEVLDAYLRVTVTNRTIKMIHEHYGFDHYLLKTPACDLQSELALGIKRKILLALADKTLYPDDPKKREEIYETYKQYLEAYTREEIEWYGLSWKEACKKHIAEKEPIKVNPLKLQFRAELIEKLKKQQLEGLPIETDEGNNSWITKINPFSKSEKTE